jgi:hypothetical protein
MLRMNLGQPRAKSTLEQHTVIHLPFSHGRRVLRSDVLNHVNLSSHGILGLRTTVNMALVPLLSHPVLSQKLNAFLYVCQDQVSYVK